MMRSLSRLLNPRSIVFIGGAECEIAVTRTRELGFTGAIHAVHPKRETLGGIATVKSAEDIPGPVDAAFIAVKRELTIDIVRTLRSRGCGGAVIYASGFKETGDDHLHHALLAAADGMPLIGPNCYGYVNGLARAALWPDEHGIKPCSGGIAIVSQSGNIACNFTFSQRALPLAAVFTIGNQADIDMAQMVEALARDSRVTAIGLHIEGLTDVPAFSKAALIARDLHKPIVALKTGRSEQGAKVALSHTSSLAGSDALYDALFDRCGVARVSSITAFLETLKFLHFGGPLSGNRLVSLSCSGGEAALVADMAQGRDIYFQPFPDHRTQPIAATLNEYVVIDNPLDYHTFIWNQEDRQRATFRAVLESGFDTGMLVLDVPIMPGANPSSWYKAARAFRDAATEAKARAAVVSTIPECMPAGLAAELAAAGVAPMLGLDDALTAFEAAAAIGRNWAREAPRPLREASQGAAPTTTLREFEAKQLLKSYGLAVPEGRVCKTGEAVQVAKTLGYPVTLKVSAAAIAHKTEAGGVALNLRSAADVEAAAARMAKLAPDVLVERMVEDAVAELIIGLSRDPQFGTALVIGAGGILTELLKDSVTLLLPASRDEIARAVTNLKVWKLVEGFRGKKGDAAAVIKSIEAVAAFASAHEGLVEELDVNPLLVLPDGAIAVDALIKMRTA